MTEFLDMKIPTNMANPISSCQNEQIITTSIFAHRVRGDSDSDTSTGDIMSASASSFSSTELPDIMKPQSAEPMCIQSPHRRQSDSSTHSTTSFESTTSTSESASSVSSDEFSSAFKEKCLQVLSRGTHAFATLNELEAAQVIKNLTCTFQQAVGGWSATVSVVVSDAISIQGHAQGQGKQPAKKAASEDLLARFTKRKSIHSTRSHPSLTSPVFQIPAFDPKPIPLSVPITSRPECRDGISKKQALQLAQDDVHVATLEDIMANAHGGSNGIACISIDVEVFDQDHSVMLEVGVSFTHLRADTHHNEVKSYHLIIEENMEVYNGKYCPNNKYNFLPEFGTSEVVRLADMPARLYEIVVKGCNGVNMAYLVGHSVHGDLDWLRAHHVDLAAFRLQECDIARAYRRLIAGDEFIGVRGMERMMEELELPCRHPHNGGNDARYNIEVLMAMMERMSHVNDYARVWAQAVGMNWMSLDGSR